jgi:hypothetical protein
MISRCDHSLKRLKTHLFRLLTRLFGSSHPDRIACTSNSRRNPRKTGHVDRVVDQVADSESQPFGWVLFGEKSRRRGASKTRSQSRAVGFSLFICDALFRSFLGSRVLGGLRLLRHALLFVRGSRRFQSVNHLGGKQQVQTKDLTS